MTSLGDWGAPGGPSCLTPTSRKRKSSLDRPDALALKRRSSDKGVGPEPDTDGADDVFLDTESVGGGLGGLGGALGRLDHPAR